MEAALLIASTIAQIRREANKHFKFFERTVENALGCHASHSSPTSFFSSLSSSFRSFFSLQESRCLPQHKPQKTTKNEHMHTNENRKTRVVSLLRSSHPLRVRVFPADAAADAQHLGRGDLIEQRHGLAGVHHEWHLFFFHTNMCGHRPTPRWATPRSHAHGQRERTKDGGKNCRGDLRAKDVFDRPWRPCEATCATNCREKNRMREMESISARPPLRQVFLYKK